MAGIGILVGAGPGHPGLITVRGKERLLSAETVLYDRLIPSELLDLIPEDAEKIFVGKRAGHHPKPQPEITRLLLEKVREGKRVVRLKGGDVFVFSRGGEEVLALHEAGLPFEIVPGITSAIAAPAFAGIPVTQKGVNTSFTVLTAHEDPTKPESMIDWGRLARQEMLVLLMGVKKLAVICERLIDGGKSAETPAALISHGVTNQQRVLAGTLATLPMLYEHNPLPTPGMIVVGEVVGLLDRIGWFENNGATGFIGETHQTNQPSNHPTTPPLRLWGRGLVRPI